MTNKLFQISGMIVGVKTTADKSLEVKVHTNDVSTFKPEELATMMAAYEKQYWIAFAEQPLKADEIDTEAEVVDKGAKSPSQRLRAVLFLLHKQTNVKEEFETYYRNKMERIIDSIKEKLDD